VSKDTSASSSSPQARNCALARLADEEVETNRAGKHQHVVEVKLAGKQQVADQGDRVEEVRKARGDVEEQIEREIEEDEKRKSAEATRQKARGDVEGLVKRGYFALGQGEADEAMGLCREAAALVKVFELPPSETADVGELEHRAGQVAQLYSEALSCEERAWAALGKGLLEQARTDCVLSVEKMEEAAVNGGLDRGQGSRGLLEQIEREIEEDEKRKGAEEAQQKERDRQEEEARQAAEAREVEEAKASDRKEEEARQAGGEREVEEACREKQQENALIGSVGHSEGFTCAKIPVLLMASLCHSGIVSWVLHLVALVAGSCLC
jgi:hypothetical protein